MPFILPICRVSMSMYVTTVLYRFLMLLLGTVYRGRIRAKYAINVTRPFLILLSSASVI
jgi:hypothetical protein